MSELTTLPVVDCWNAIGVKGDRSCPKLREVIHCHNCSVFADAARTFLDRPAPPGYLSEVSESLSRTADVKAPQSISAVVFEVGDQLLSIETRAVVEVTTTRSPHRVGQRTGRIFAGIVNIHGQLELCCSLAGLLQIDAARPETAGGTARMLLTEHQGMRWAFEAALVHGAHRFEAADISAIPATSQEGSSYMKSVLCFGERRAGLLDLDKTFRALEGSLR